jgi:hypothetical protein
VEIRETIAGNETKILLRLPIEDYVNEKLNFVKEKCGKILVISMN